MPKAEFAMKPIFGKPPDVQEALLHLYLRLNGYFVSGFILHSEDQGRNAAELDAVAVRHQFQSEPRREVGPSEFLAPTKTDVLICEVKSGGRPTFNKALRNSEARIGEVLQWIGLFDAKASSEMAKRLKPLLRPDADRKIAEEGIWDAAKEVRVRGLLCSPQTQTAGPDSPWMLDGSKMFGYVAKCLGPEFERVACSSRYNFEGWGCWLAPLVRYFKETRGNGVGDMNDLYRFLEIEGLLRHVDAAQPTNRDGEGRGAAPS